MLTFAAENVDKNIKNHLTGEKLPCNFAVLKDVFTSHRNFKYMRFKLTLEVLADKFGRDIPINYQYELSAVIYKILSSANEEFSSWLHENGFVCEDGDKVKRFKLFTFSWLMNGKFDYKVGNGRLRIKSDTVDWIISFLPEISTEKFVQGVFKNRTFEVGDKISTVKFRVNDIKLMPSITYRNEMEFKTLSPLCLRRKIDNGGVEYMSPRDEDAKDAIFAGLVSKYKAFSGNAFNLYKDFEFEVISEPMSKLIKIKSDSKSQTMVRGYMFSFRIKADEELIKVMYESGLGEECSQGFGCVTEINNII